MEFGILGSLQVSSEGRPLPVPRGKRASLLVALLVRHNQVVSADDLGDWLWGPDTPVNAAAAVRSQVSRLRAALALSVEAAAMLRTQGAGYELRLHPDALDAVRFERLVGEARRLRSTDPPAAASTYWRALKTWRGPALQGFTDAVFACADARRLEELRLTAVGELVEAEIVQGRHAAVVGELQAWVAAHPTHEHLTAQLMRALYYDGRQAEALQAFSRLRERLADQLGIDPSAELRRLERAILRQEVADPTHRGTACSPPSWTSRPTLWAAPAASAEMAAVPLPVHLAHPPSPGFVGRVCELATLTGAFTEVAAGHGRRLVLVAGEPGMGKTTLAGELGRHVHGRGAVVLYGRCDEDLGIRYQPFAQAFDHYVLHAPDEVLSAHVAQHGGQLATLTPSLVHRVDELPPDRSADAAARRHLLFGAAVGLLETASTRAPVVIVVDDLHWADRPTLLLLRYLVGAPGPVALLVVGTYRQTELSRTHPLAETLGTLRREPGVQRVELSGWQHRDVVALIESTAGRSLNAEETQRAGALCDETGGNPFFILEMLRQHLEAAGRDEVATPGLAIDVNVEPRATPEGLREVITGRVARLGERAEELLGLAAVVGREFDLELLMAASAVSEEDLVGLLDDAVAARLVDDLCDGAGRYGFAHSVIHQTLYGTLSPGRRRLGHRRVAEALEKLHGAGPGPHAAELARHWLTAAPPADTRTAIDHARWAGEAALAGLAPEEAVRWLDMALEVAGRYQDADRRLRAELLVGLGSAQRLAGDPAHRGTLLDAARLAQGLGDEELLVRAALANNRGTLSEVGVVDAERVVVIEAALTATADETPERARLLATLAAELTAGDWARRRELAYQALSLARRLGDREGVVTVANLIHMCIWVPETIEQRLAMTEEMLTLVETSTDPALLHWTHRWRAYACACAGDVSGFDTSLPAVARFAEESRDPGLIWAASYMRAWRALQAGDLEEAERLATKALRIGSDGGAPEAMAGFVGQLTEIRRQQGRVDEVRDFLAGAVNSFPQVRLLRAILARVYCELGEDDRAADLLHTEAAADFSKAPYDVLWLPTMAVFAEVCGSLGRVEPAARLLEQLAPWRGQMVYDNCSTWGSVALPLGMLATVLRRYDEAEARFAEAVAVHERAGAPFLIASTHLECATMLLARAAPGDEERAERLLKDVDATAARFGFHGLLRRSSRLRGRAACAEPHPEPQGERSCRPF